MNKVNFFKLNFRGNAIFGGKTFHRKCSQNVKINYKNVEGGSQNNLRISHKIVQGQKKSKINKGRIYL